MGILWRSLNVRDFQRCYEVLVACQEAGLEMTRASCGEGVMQTRLVA